MKKKIYIMYDISLIKYLKCMLSKNKKITCWAFVSDMWKRIAKEYYDFLIDNNIEDISKNTRKTNIGRCLGVTKKGLVCSRFIKENSYCFQHRLKEASVNNLQEKKLQVSNVQNNDNILNTSLNKVLVMDCIAGLKKLPKESASIIICDPPYNNNKDFGNSSDKQELKEYLKWCKVWIKECLRVLCKDGLLYIYGFSETLAHIQVTCVKNIYIRWLVWHYTNKVSPNSNFWQRSHESILCCSKVKFPYFNKDLIREPYSESYKKLSGKTRKNTKGRFGNKTTVYSVNDLGALPRDVIKIPALVGSFGSKERVKEHPTQKPVVLCEKLIKSTLNKNKNNLLVVPFVGSGSECVAAKNLSVSFIGFEINNKFATLANNRIKKLSCIK